ncbi:MAG: cytochrome d ubiquinol oxidase subunit II, partial [Armatimonadota bacterium]|nr:cytochrome d ubiquinol oxidase subunit II [Armatimonadota bacterium]
MFAAFPHWYATLFSGFYLALGLVLLALIARGAAFEFRSKVEHPRWRTTWDTLIFFGSAIPAFLWGVAFANILRGVPIDAAMHYTGGFFNLLHPYALVGGLASLGLFTLHGALFLTLRLEGEPRVRAAAAVRKVGPAAAGALALAWGYSLVETDLAARPGAIPLVVSIAGAAALLIAGWAAYRQRHGWAFAMTGLTIIAAVATIFSALFPRVMVSSSNPGWSLTIYNAASSPYTLKVMSIVALLFVPVVIAYQSWSYWVFTRRVGRRAPAS